MIAPPCRSPASAAEIYALFAEAHRRRRRRRLVGAAVCLVLTGAAAAGLAGGGGHDHDRAPRVTASARPPAATAKRAARLTLPATRVAWVDYLGQLHVGDVATRTQHIVATFPSGAGGWFVAAAGHLYWPDFSTDIAPIRDYDVRTGKIRYLANGESVFASADRRHVYVRRSGTALIELRAGRSGPYRSLTVPAGWHLSFPQPVAVADGGIVVSQDDAHQNARPPAFAVWTPATWRLKIVGRDGDVMAEYTPRHGRHSLLAWSSGPCPDQNCLIKITNTSTLATVTLRSPLRHGFADPGAAFSPDGAQLAVFARTASISSYRDNISVLAIASTRTGRLRLVPGARLSTSEDAGSALWLPDGRHLLAGAAYYSYAVAAHSLAARPFSFFPGYGQYYMDPRDISFGAVVIAGRHGERAAVPDRAGGSAASRVRPGTGRQTVRRRPGRAS